MHKAKNIYFILIKKKKKTRWPKAGGSPRQGTVPYHPGKGHDYDNRGTEI